MSCSLGTDRVTFVQTARELPRDRLGEADVDRYRTSFADRREHGGYTDLMVVALGGFSPNAERSLQRDWANARSASTTWSRSMSGWTSSGQSCGPNCPSWRRPRSRYRSPTTPKRLTRCSPASGTRAVPRIGPPAQARLWSRLVFLPGWRLLEPSCSF